LVRDRKVAQKGRALIPLETILDRMSAKEMTALRKRVSIVQ